MRGLLAWVGIAVAVALAIVSAAMNYVFWSRVGSTPVEQVLLGSASVGLDLFKVLLPLLIARAARGRQHIAVVCGVALFIALTAGSLTASFGFAAMGRRTAAQAEAAHRSRSVSAQHEMVALDHRIAALGLPRPSSVVAQQLRVMELDPLWKATRGCTVIPTLETRAYCKGRGELQLEAIRASELASLEQKRSEIRKPPSGNAETTEAATAESQVTYLSGLSGRSAENVRLILTLLFALTIEAGSGLGLLLATMTPNTPPPAIGSYRRRSLS